MNPKGKEKEALLPESSRSQESELYPLVDNKDQKFLSDIIIQSPWVDLDSAAQAAAIREKFNQNVTQGQSYFTESVIRGVSPNPDQFVLGHRNKTPELATFSPGKKIARIWDPRLTVSTKTLGVFKWNAPYYGAFGSHVLNVPNGQLAKAVSGVRPYIFGPGPHVIHDQNFKFDPDTGFVDQKEPYIQHLSLHILRVSAGQLAPVMIGGTIPRLLAPASQPYVFADPLFARSPYTRNGHTYYFYDTTERVIVHGSIKRIQPHAGEVAIAFDGGTREIIEPNTQPRCVDSPNYQFSTFLSTTIQSIVFPSEKTQRIRQEKNSKLSADELTYQIMTTKDSVRIGVQLFVAYRIADPKKTMEFLKDESAILDHIEYCAVTDMNSVVQGHTSLEFLSSQQANTKPPANPDLVELDNAMTSSSSNAPNQLLKQIQDKLRKGLAEYGIELVRLNFETPKLMDEKLAQEMSKQSLRTAEVYSTEAVMEQQFRIAKRKAEQEAETNRIGQDQANSVLVKQAYARLEAAKTNADAMKVEAEGHKAAVIIKAEGEREAAGMRGKVYKENPELLQLELFRTQMDALSKAQIVPTQMLSLLTNANANFLTAGVANSPFTLFAPSSQQRTLGVVSVADIPKTAPGVSAGNS